MNCVRPSHTKFWVAMLSFDTVDSKSWNILINIVRDVS